MFDVWELFRSVEIIWVIWLVSCLSLATMTVIGLSRVRWSGFLKQAIANEDGAAYALSYVMVVPLYFIFVCLVVETSHMLVTKAGTVYAACAGARTAIVWDSAASESEVRQRVTDSARQAFVPFASGVRIKGAPAATPSSNQKKYADVYEDYASDPAVSRGNLMNKLANANDKLAVDYRRPGSWIDDAEVEVEYQYRFYVPVIGHALGTKGDDGYRYYSMKSTIKLQNEAPQNDAQRTGISYASPD